MGARELRKNHIRGVSHDPDMSRVAAFSAINSQKAEIVASTAETAVLFLLESTGWNERMVIPLFFTWRRGTKQGDGQHNTPDILL